jgi:hypothetical protein
MAPAKKTLVQEKANCRAEYGSLRLCTSPSGVANRYWIFVDDQKSNIHKEQLDGTLAQAKHIAVVWAQNYLQARGEPHEFRVAWICS